MLKNYFVVALRNFWRNKTFSLINILGLAIGISASLVIFLLIHHDLTYDKFEPNPNRIYRVVAENYRPGNDEPGYQQSLPVPMASAILKETTGTDLVVPFHTWDEVKVTIPIPMPASQRYSEAKKTSPSPTPASSNCWVIPG